MFGRDTAALVGAGALLVSSLAGCEKAHNPAPEPAAVQTWAERHPRGYEDVGNGVFFIQGQRHDGIENQRAQALALANFRADHPNLEVTKTIQLDAHNYYSHMGGIVLWTSNGDPTKSATVNETVHRPEAGK